MAVHWSKQKSAQAKTRNKSRRRNAVVRQKYFNMSEVTQSLVKTARHLDNLIQNIQGLQLNDEYTAEKEDTILNGMWVGWNSSFFLSTDRNVDLFLLAEHRSCIQNWMLSGTFMPYLTLFYVMHMCQQPIDSKSQSSWKCFSAIPAESSNWMPRVSGNLALDVYQECNRVFD